jgi:L-histidine Nalpha-methyltransferase
LALGEEMRTEVSAKFRERVTADLAAAGFDLADPWTDPQGRVACRFSVGRLGPSLSVGHVACRFR